MESVIDLSKFRSLSKFRMQTAVQVLEQSQSPSTDRALDIFEALSSAIGGLTLSELVRATELPQNSVYRITSALLARGYLHRRENDKRFTLSNKLFDLARPRVNEKSLVVCSYEALRELRTATSETVQLLAPSGRKVVVLEQVSGLHPVKVMGEVGLRVPMHSCAPGKAILAWMPEPELETWIAAAPLKRYTPTTRATREQLLADLLGARARGFAIDRAEGLEGIHCVAAPILNEYEIPVAAVTVMAPIFRLREDEFEPLGRKCIAAAAKIRERLLN
ncbi:MAG: DNA-binding IclR family transcriptional regulator [Verrucomicrobiales bacterium]|jgi:DNA-binding IclR family transcriptional regulator